MESSLPAHVATTPLQRKLMALSYHTPQTPALKDPVDLKRLVVWLEDQKIRHYKIDEREQLRNETAGDTWMVTFKKYLTDLQCPFDPNTSLSSSLQWLLDEAIRYEFEDATKSHPNLCRGLKSPESIKAEGSRPSALDISPADPIFKRGTEALAKILQVTNHFDPTVLLAACRLVIEEKLSETEQKKWQENSSASFSKKPKTHDVTPKQCGFNLGDPVLGEAAKVLRILHINELRDLQTRINELIVSVQSITANPKTDSSLGKVGK